MDKKHICERWRRMDDNPRRPLCQVPSLPTSGFSPVTRLLPPQPPLLTPPSTKLSHPPLASAPLLACCHPHHLYLPPLHQSVPSTSGFSPVTRLLPHPPPLLNPPSNQKCPIHLWLQPCYSPVATPPPLPNPPLPNQPKVSRSPHLPVIFQSPTVTPIHTQNFPPASNPLSKTHHYPGICTSPTLSHFPQCLLNIFFFVLHLLCPPRSCNSLPSPAPPLKKLDAIEADT